MRWAIGLILAATLVIAGCTGSQPGTTETGPKSKGAPLATASYGPLAPAVGEAVAFDATGSASSTQVVKSVAWEFGDGKTGTGITATHTYSLPGDYVVRVKVTNDADLSATNEATPVYVRVSPAAFDVLTATPETLNPVAKVVTNAQIVQKGTLVEFDGASSHGWAANGDFNASRPASTTNLPFEVDAAALAEFSWDFGDGTAPLAGNRTATAATTHAYAEPGLYAAKLTVKDANGKTGSAAVSVLVLGDPPAVGGYKHKDIFVTAQIGGPQSLDPGFDYESAGGQVLENTYERLFGVDRGNVNKIVPVLAAEVPTLENGGIQDGAKRYVIKIRQGVKFHDGTSLDAEAVKFSLDRAILMKDPNSGAAVFAPVIKGAEHYRTTSGTVADRAAYLAEKGVEVLDEHTIAINLPRPDAAFFQRLAFYGASIVSPAAIKAPHAERVPLWGVPTTPDGLPPATPPGGAAITRDPWADTHIVGTGPFKLRAWLANDRIVLDRNEDYWGTKPQMRTVIIQYVDDLNTRLLMFRSGDADDIYVPPGADVDRVRPQLEKIARFVPADTLIIDAAFFTRDVKATENCPKDATGAPACDFFMDENVRKAFIYSFDFDSFIKDVWGGRAKALAGVIPRGMPGYDENLAPYKRDVEKAKEHLAQSKFKDGFTIDVYYNNGNRVRQGGSELLAKGLRELLPEGKITVNVRGVPFAELLSKSQKSELPAFFLGWSPDYIATDDYVYPFLHSKGTYSVSTSFKDEELDAKIDAALAELDLEKQAAMWREINKLGTEKHVHMFLDQRSQVHIERTYVTGYYYSPLHSGSPTVGDYSTIGKA